MFLGDIGPSQKGSLLLLSLLERGDKIKRAISWSCQGKLSHRLEHAPSKSLVVTGHVFILCPQPEPVAWLAESLDQGYLPLQLKEDSRVMSISLHQPIAPWAHHSSQWGKDIPVLMVSRAHPHPSESGQSSPAHAPTAENGDL